MRSCNIVDLYSFLHDFLPGEGAGCWNTPLPTGLPQSLAYLGKVFFRGRGGGGLLEFRGSWSLFSTCVSHWLFGSIERKGAWRLLTVLPFSWKCELVRIIIAGALRPARPLVCSAACRNMVGRVGEERGRPEPGPDLRGTQTLCFSSWVLR